MGNELAGPSGTEETKGDRPTGRRAAITAGLVTAAAVAVSGGSKAQAADGDSVVLGTTNDAKKTTTITASPSGPAVLVQNATEFGVALEAEALTETGFGVGVYGRSAAPNGRGVFGEASNSAGSGIGVRGIAYSSTGIGLVASAPATGEGVVGYSGDTAPPLRPGVGVHGSSSSGVGVRGDTSTGTAIVAETPVVDGLRTGVALAATGRVVFTNCAGVTRIAGGRSSVTISPGIDLLPTSAVVATLQGSAGGSTTVKYVAVDAAANKFTIYLTARAAAAGVNVAWHLFG